MRQVNFGLWYDFRNPGNKLDFETFYSRNLDQIEEAENLGFDSVWLTEHHFTNDGYAPSPLVIAAAIAQRTKRMRIATNLMLLPLADPVRLAEDAATVSILSGGRFDLGIGLGYRQLEFDYFNRKISHRPSLMEEGIEIIKKAWSGETFSYKGKRFQIDSLEVSPAPVHPPRILIGGMSEPAIERAVRMGDGFLSTGGIGHDLYRAALGDKPGAIYAGHWGIVGEDPEKEWNAVAEHVLYQSNQYISWGAFGPPESTPLLPDTKSALDGGFYELFDGPHLVESLTKQLTDWPEIKDIHFWAQFPGEPIDNGTKRMQYIANEVLPKVRENLQSL